MLIRVSHNGHFRCAACGGKLVVGRRGTLWFIKCRNCHKHMVEQNKNESIVLAPLNYKLHRGGNGESK